MKLFNSLFLTVLICNALSCSSANKVSSPEEQEEYLKNANDRLSSGFDYIR